MHPQNSLVKLFFVIGSISTAQETPPLISEARDGLAISPQGGNGMQFLENKGQVVDMNGQPRPDILFSSAQSNTTIYLRKTGWSYVLDNFQEIKKIVDEKIELEKQKSNTSKIEQSIRRNELTKNETIKFHRIDVDLMNCNPSATILPLNEVEGYQNFYLGHRPNGITGAKEFNKIVYREIYPKTDLIFYGNKQNGMKYDLVLRPGSDPENIVLKYNGASGVELANGKLKVTSSLGELGEYMPKVYQIIEGKIVDVKAEYILNNSSGNSLEISFKVGTFNRNYALVIDPAVWSTYHGNAGRDETSSIKAQYGSVVVSGNTMINTFPVSVGAYFSNFQGGFMDAFLVKFDADGKRLWSTYFGGNVDDNSVSVELNSNSDIFINGWTTSANLPVTPGAFQSAYAGGRSDSYVAKFSSAGNLIWSTYMGGTNTEYAGSLDVDANNNVVVLGCTFSNDFPVLSAFQGTNLGVSDIVLFKFNSTGTLQWSTYYGGSQADIGTAVKIDINNDIVFTGCNENGNLPTTPGAFQQNYQSKVRDGFVSKFTSNGVRLFTSYIGGNGDEIGQCITTDLKDNIIVGISGYLSTNLPSTPGAYQINPSTGTAPYENFLIKFNPLGNRQWATYMGSIYNDMFSGLATNEFNDIIYVWEFEDLYGLINGIQPGIPNTCGTKKVMQRGDPEDMIITKFDENGNLICNTFWGGNAEDDLDHATEPVSYDKGFIYLTGFSMGMYPVTPGAFQTAYSPQMHWDPVITKLCSYSCAETYTANFNFSPSANNICLGQSINITNATSLSLNCDTTQTEYEWTFYNAVPSTSTAKSPTGIKYSTPGKHNVKLIIRTPCLTDSVTTTNFITVNSSVQKNDTVNICQGLFAQIHGSNQNISGVYSQTFVAANGCDSISSVTLNVKSTSTNTISITACKTYSLNAQIYNSGGIYSQTLTSASGCDSVLTIDLTINGAINTSATQNICQGQYALIHGVNQNMPGLYAQTLTTTSGCDSISSITLAVNSVSSTTINASACSSYNLNGQNYTSSGIYSQTLSAALGCDSLLTINLTINSNTSTADTQKVCQGESVFIHGVDQRTPGVYTQTFVSANGCDSISSVSLNLYPNPNAAFIATPPLGALQNTVIYFTDQSQGKINSWQWSFGDANNNTSYQQNPSFTFRDTGIYLLQLIVINEYGCADTATNEFIINGDVTLYVSNAFTPNGDGINDVFMPLSSGTNFLNFEMWIYDRWGNLIYETNDLNSGWDGRANGGKDVAQQDTYVWKLKTQDIFGVNNKYVGHVNLIR